MERKMRELVVIVVVVISILSLTKITISAPNKSTHKQITAGVTSSFYETAKNTEVEETAEEPIVEVVIESTEVVAESYDSTIYYSKCNKLNIRQEPNTSSKKIGRYNFNDEVVVLEYNDDWSRVLYGDQEGYVKSEYLKDDIKDISCKKAYEPKQFKNLGIVSYGGYSYTWYSQRVLPGGGLNIPGRHTNEDGFVCDEDGYIVIASSILKKGTIVNTPVGIQGKVYDYNEGSSNLDIYVNW